MMIEPEQRTAAKVAGFMYLFTLLTANFAEFYARGRLIISGDAVQTANNIAGSERLFRLGAVSNMVTFAGCVLLLWALYVVLKPVNKNVALLAAFWRLAECAIFALVILNDFVTLRLVSAADYLRAFNNQQVQALAYTFVRAHDAGILSAWCFTDWGRPYLAICFSSRVISLERWPLWESSLP